MITRPLDLVSNLRPEPRNFGALFFICVGMIGLQFALFGSRFVLSPALGVQFDLPTSGAAGAFPATHRVTVGKSGGIITSDGPMSPAQFADWLRNESGRLKELGLLIQADGAASIDSFNRVVEIARDAHIPVAYGVNERSKAPVPDSKQP